MAHGSADLQRVLHAPRRHPDLSLHHPRDSRLLRQYLPPHSARGPGRGLPADQPPLLVALCDRGAGYPPVPLPARPAAGHGLDLLRAIQHPDPREYLDRGPGGLHPGIFLHPYGAQLRHHHPPDAGAGDDLVPDARLRLDTLCHGLGADAGDAGSGHHAPLHRPGPVLRRGLFRSRQGRRPDPLRAPLLDVFPSGGLHHGPAGHGDHQRDRSRLFAEGVVRLRCHLPVGPGHRHRRLRRLGAPHVHQRHERHGSG